MSALPAEFLERMKSQLASDFDGFVKAITTDSPVSVLSNPKKTFIPPEGSVEVPWNPNGYYLHERPTYALDPMYHAGSYYPQEASSMIHAHLLPQLALPEHPLVLDLCGAPGGKSLNLLNFLEGRGHLLSNEVIRKRVGILQENVSRWGHFNVSISSTSADRIAELGPLFDLVVVDAPCSGEGLFRKDIRSADQWSPASVMHCAARQGRILEYIAKAVKPGGWLIYSTCTFSEAENSMGIQVLESAGFHSMKPELSEDWGWTWSDVSKGFQAYPHRVRGEGLFFALFRKAGEGSSDSVKRRDDSSKVDTPSWIDIPADSLLYEDDKGLIHIRSRHLSGSQEYLYEKLRIIGQGLPIGQWKGKDFIPAHGAIMAGLEMDVKRISLSLEQALDYLRLDTLSLESHENGWYILTYNSLDIGWGKMVNGRLKNHYPKAWRLRQRR